MYHALYRIDGDLLSACVSLEWHGQSSLLHAFQRTATDTLLGYSKTLSCSAILQELLPHFAASPEDWEPDALAALDPALHVLYITDRTIRYSGDVSLADLYADGEVQYTEDHQ